MLCKARHGQASRGLAGLGKVASRFGGWPFQNKGVLSMVFDLTGLRAGDVVSVETIEASMGVDRNHRDYPMQQMILSKEIEKTLWNVGKNLTVRCVGLQIKVLTQEESVEYNESIFESGKRKMRLAHKRASAIDVSGFTEDQRRDHFERLGKQGVVLAAMRKRITLTLDATERSTPSMI